MPLPRRSLSPLLRPLPAAAVFALAASVAYPQRGDAPGARPLPPAEAQSRFRLPPGFGIQLVAAEPDLPKPFNLAFDAAGRLWVTGSSLYPWPARRDALGQEIPSFQKNWDDNALAFRAASTPPAPADDGADTVRILSDFDPVTGRARRIATFADGLNVPVGILPLPRPPGARGDAALVFSIPAIWRLTDTDGDGRADLREKLYDGFGFKDTHGMSSSYTLWYDGWVYGTHGFANVSTVQDRSGRITRLTSGNTYRFRPDGSRFELHAHGQTNPFGLDFDPRGDLYTADSHSKPVYLILPGGYYEGIGVGREHDGLGYAPAITTDDHGSSAIAGLAHYSARQFPPEFRDNLFNGNPVTRRLNRVRLDWRGSSPLAVRQPDFLSSDDPTFRPVQVVAGPDGALWVADFCNPIIGHYEVPLTHPDRDRTHGRIWRIVWRGLDGRVPPPAVPDLTARATAALVAACSDADPVVRRLAVSELLVRPDAAAAGPALLAAADRLVAGTDPAADPAAALPLFLALARLRPADPAGAPDPAPGFDALLDRALDRPGSDVALAALHVRLLHDRPLPPSVRAALADLPQRTGNHHVWRAAARLLGRHRETWAAAALLALLLAAPDYDPQLIYTVRLALKHHLLSADRPAFDTLLAGAAPAAARTAAAHLAGIALAVPTAASAEFLLAHLETTRFDDARAGDFARHVVLHLPPARRPALLPLLDALAAAPRAQRLAFAEGLALLARPSPAAAADPLPPTLAGWMQHELLSALGERESALVLRALEALRPLPLPAKAAPLRDLALDPRARDAHRTAALRALDPAHPGTEAALVAVLGQPAAANALRRTAADLLGSAHPSPAARAALTAAFPSASADLALALAAALARSDAGAADLLDLAAAGRVRPQLLRHRHLELAFGKRPPDLRARAADLARNLPAEDARLDALIAQRLAAAAAHRPDPARGAALFAQHCAACHRFQDTGGSLGPSLDGSAARTVARLVEDILDPGRNVDPAFRLVTVTLRSGATAAGLDYRAESDRRSLLDPATGQRLAFSAADVVSAVPSPASAMPAVFDTLLPDADLFDLVAHLRGSLR